MYQTNKLLAKWGEILESKDAAPITDNYRKVTTAVLLENQHRASRNLNEDGPVSQMGGSNPTTGPIKTTDPVLIALVRRTAPMLIAYDVCGVQPMTTPTGTIFALKSVYVNNTEPAAHASWTEAFYQNINSGWSGQAWNVDAQAAVAGAPYANTATTYAQQLASQNYANTTVGSFDYGTGMTRAAGEGLGYTYQFNQMSFTIDKITATAETRGLKAEYSVELQQDLKAIHGLDAETELTNILSTEILADQNREVIEKIYRTAKVGCQTGSTTTAGVFNLDVDANGRWSVEKFKGLIFQMEREANKIAQETRRGKGNIIICSPDVASAMAMAGLLDYTPDLKANLDVDATNSTYVGKLNGRFNVYIDPYFFVATSGANTAWEYAVVGYKGSSPYDAGMFYCPYVPLQMYKATDPNTFQPKVGFKTRYATVLNPFVGDRTGIIANNTANSEYYRRFAITNLM